MAADAPASAAPAVSVSLDTSQLPSSPGYHIIKATARMGAAKLSITTGLFLPRAYFRSKEPMPIVITLHNRGMSGSDGRDLTFEGLAMLIGRDNVDTRGGGEMPKDPVNLRRDGQFIGVAPQCPQGYRWDTPPIAQMISELATQIAIAYHADDDRVYLTGFSYGGFHPPGRWHCNCPIASPPSSPSPAARHQIRRVIRLS